MPAPPKKGNSSLIELLLSLAGMLLQIVEQGYSIKCYEGTNFL